LFQNQKLKLKGC